MCQFNAQRDAHLLKAIRLKDGSVWQPLLGRTDPEQTTQHTVRADSQGLVSYPIKYLKGRSRMHAMSERRKRASS